MAAITHERESSILGASTIASYVERSEGDGNNILEEGSAMSATDKLVEKNCRRAELRYLADREAVRAVRRPLTWTSGDPLGSYSRSVPRLNLRATRGSR